MKTFSAHRENFSRKLAKMSSNKRNLDLVGNEEDKRNLDLVGNEKSSQMGELKKTKKGESSLKHAVGLGNITGAVVANCTENHEMAEDLKKS